MVVQGLMPRAEEAHDTKTTISGRAELRGEERRD
jgi:hypothetical protein